MTNDRLESVFAPSDRIVGRRIAEEFLLVPLARQTAQIDSLFNLNAVAAFIWEQIDGRKNGHAIVAALLDRFEVERKTAERDYLSLVDELLALGAIHRQDQN